MKLRGHAAFNLTSELCPKRLSSSAKSRIDSWTERFHQPDPAPVGIRSFSVGSPIEEAATEKMSDDQWLGAISKYDSIGRRFDPKDPERGGALELALLLQKQTKADPIRFGQFAFEIPSDANPYYFSHLIRGLKDSDAPTSLKLDVVRLVFGFDHKDCIQEVLSLLETISDEKLPDEAIEFVARSAQNGDPESELWDEGTPNYGGDLRTHGINTVRGNATGTIRELIRSDSSYLEKFADTIDLLVEDPSVAVRSCVASLLLVVATHDEPLMVTLSSRLLACDERLLACNTVQDLIHRGLQAHWKDFSATIERMLSAKYEKVREAGGRLAGLARLYHEGADGLSEAAASGDAFTRIGACDVARSNLLDPGCREWCESTLRILFCDESEQVRKEAARCFWHLWKSPETPLSEFSELIDTFISSPAFKDDPSFLLHAFEDTKQKVPESALKVCEEFIAQCSEAARDIRTSLAGDEHTVGKLVFTAYSQMQSRPLRNRALDVIDRMHLEGLNSVNTHLEEFDR